MTPPTRQPVWIVIRLLILPVLAVAQTSPPDSTQDTVYQLHGTVRNALTGKPLPRALVVSNDRRLATMTDSEGRFTLQIAIPAKPQVEQRRMSGSMSLRLTAQKPNFLADNQAALNLSLDETLATKEAELKLMPAAAVVGRVSTADTDTPRGVPVQLLMHVAQEGVLTWMQAAQQNTNTSGEFRFTDLHAGEYTVMSPEWRGNQPLPLERTAITQQYPPIFLGDAATLATAIPLHLHPGDITPADLHLHRASYYPITIPVAGQPPGSFVNVRVGGAVSGYALGYNPQDSAVEGSLPDGDYSLILSSFGPQPAFAQLAIHIAGAPLRTPPIALAPAGKITVHVRWESTAQSATRQQPQPSAPRNVFLSFESEDLGLGQGGAGGGESEFQLDNVFPGRYFINAHPSTGYIASITSGGVDLAQSPLVTTPTGSADPIDITVHDDVATLTGNVTGSGPTPANYLIVLIPADASARFNQTFTPIDAKFTIPNIVPGNYVAFATAGFRQIPYRDAEAMRAYEGKGVPLTFAPGQQLNADVPFLSLEDLPE